MERKTFRGQYPLRFWMQIPVLMFFGIGSIVMSIWGPAELRRVEVATIGIFIGFPLMMLGGIVRQVEFESNQMVIHRLWWPRRAMLYSDIVDVGIRTVKGRNWSFGYAQMENGAALRERIGALIGRGRIRREQLENKTDQEEAQLWPQLVVAGLVGSGLAYAARLSGVLGSLDQFQMPFVQGALMLLALLVLRLIQRLGARR